MAKVCDFCGIKLEKDSTTLGWTMALFPMFERVPNPIKYDVCQECLEKLKRDEKK